MREKLRKVMAGRYGTDALGRFLLILVLIILLLSGFFFRKTLYIISLLILFIVYYRILSRDISRRYRENQIFLGYKSKFESFIRKQKYMIRQRRVYRIFKCPGCSQKIRIPKGKGKVQITCPKCGTQFIRRS